MRYTALGGRSQFCISVRTCCVGQLAAISSRIARREARETSSSLSASARFSTSFSSTINSELRVTRNWYAPLNCFLGIISATISDSTVDRTTKSCSTPETFVGHWMMSGSERGERTCASWPVGQQAHVTLRMQRRVLAQERVGGEG